MSYCDKIRVFKNTTGICWFNTAIVSLFFSDDIGDYCRKNIFYLKNKIPVGVKFKKTNYPVQDVILYLIMEVIRKGIAITEESNKTKAPLLLRQSSLDLCSEGLGPNLNNLCNSYKVRLGQSNSLAGGNESIFIEMMKNYYLLERLNSFYSTELVETEKIPMLNIIVYIITTLNLLKIIVNKPELISSDTNLTESFLKKNIKLLINDQNYNDQLLNITTDLTKQNILQIELVFKEIKKKLSNLSTEFSKNIENQINKLKLFVNKGISNESSKISAINIDYSIKNEFMGHAVSIIKCNNKYYFYDTNILKKDGSGKLIYCDDKLDNNLKETLVKCEKTLKENEYDKDSINYIENLSIISYGGGKNEKMEFNWDLNKMNKLIVDKFSANITAINFLSLTDESLIDKVKDCNGSNNNFVINEDLSKEEQFVENIFKCCSSNKEKLIYMLILKDIIINHKDLMEHIFTDSKYSTLNDFVNTKINDLLLNQTGEINFEIFDITIKSVVEKLIEYGVNPLEEKYGLYPILNADNKETIELLIEKEADINLTDSNDGNALHFLHYDHRSVSILKSLKDKENQLGKTPIFFSKNEKIFKEIYKLLDDTGVNHQDKEGQTFIFQFIRYKSVALHEILTNIIKYSKINFNHITNNGENILFYCSQDELLFKKFIESNVMNESSFLQKDSNGRTLLFYIKTTKQIELILGKIPYNKKESFITTVDNNGDYAINFNISSEVCAFMLTQYENYDFNYDDLITQTDKIIYFSSYYDNLRTPFVKKIMSHNNKKKLKLAKHILRQDFMNVQIRDNYNNTFFHDCKDIEILQILSDKGLDINYPNKNGETPFLLLIARGNSYNVDYTNVIDKMIELRADPTIVDNFGRSILYRVDEIKWTKKIKEILTESQWNTMINLKDKSGNIPLFITYDKDKYNYLIDNGADLNIKGEGNNTILHRLPRILTETLLDKIISKINFGINEENDNGEYPVETVYDINLLKLLHKKGANICRTNKEGKNIIHNNQQYDNDNVIWEYIKSECGLDDSDKIGGGIPLKYMIEYNPKKNSYYPYLLNL